MQRQTLPEIQYNGARQIACRQFISGLDSHFMTTAKAVCREPTRTLLAVPDKSDPAFIRRTPPMETNDVEHYKYRLVELRVEHRDLDDVIARLAKDPLVDELELKRLKKRKLMLKDMIAHLESKIIPDLNA